MHEKEEVDELMCKIAQQTFGGLDIVINSAGQMLSSKITDYHRWVIVWLMRISKALYILAQAALPTMLEQLAAILLTLHLFLALK